MRSLRLRSVLPLHFPLFFAAMWWPTAQPTSAPNMA
jgi:hypothetical protein